MVAGPLPESVPSRPRDILYPLAVEIDSDLLQHPNVMEPEPETPIQIIGRASK
jgi:hypothetical protein